MDLQNVNDKANVTAYNPPITSPTQPQPRAPSMSFSDIKESMLGLFAQLPPKLQRRMVSELSTNLSKDFPSRIHATTTLFREPLQKTPSDGGTPQQNQNQMDKKGSQKQR